MPSLIREKITLPVADGSEMDAYVSRPDTSRSLPGLIVLQEAYGVNRHIRNIADRFAQQGYLAMAPELFHRTARGFEGDYNNFNSVTPHMRAMTLEGNEADLRASLEWLTKQKTIQTDNISSVGYCMGGRVSFLANATLPLHAACSYYGGGIADCSTKSHRCTRPCSSSGGNSIGIFRRSSATPSPARSRPLANGM
jgi:carboxymethylenebutenolidase